MKKQILFTLAFVLSIYSASAFCGFYVAKADAQLFNKSSQVIIARDGDQTVVTMSSDYQGEVKDFAMVVPVPEVLKRKDIRVVRQDIFKKLDDYSGPRLVEYYDRNPCAPQVEYMMDAVKSTRSMATIEEVEIAASAKKHKVKIEAQYQVEEYDILILSAKESTGLESWLIENGYKIPKGAYEVLEPYIKSDMKFFVVKVNLEKYNQGKNENLRPLQITYNSGNFMLPIRLGMANANGDQDLIIYAFTKKGRVETTNYRTTKIPTDKNIPTFVKQKFGQFYVDLFNRAWKKEGKNITMLEYAWDLSSDNFVKCDPCATTPPVLADLKEAGIFWVDQRQNNRWNGSDYEGDVFITRMHVRYNRSTFPQDLNFQITPNTENFQGRYIMTHPATGSLECEAAQQYLKTLVERREKELNELYALTGSKSGDYQNYVEKYRKMIKEPEIQYQSPDKNMDPPNKKDRGDIHPKVDHSDKAEIILPDIDDDDLENNLAYQPVKDQQYTESSTTPAATITADSRNTIFLLIALVLGSAFYLLKAFREKKSE